MCRVETYTYVELFAIRISGITGIPMRAWIRFYRRSVCFWFKADKYYGAIHELRYTKIRTFKHHQPPNKAENEG